MPEPSRRASRRGAGHTAASADPARLLREALAAYGLSRRQLRRLAGLAPHELQTALRSTEPAPELRALLAIQTAMLTPLRRERICHPADVAGLLMTRLGHCDQENLLTVCLDTHNCVQDIALVYQGNVRAAVVRMAEVFKRGPSNSTAVRSSWRTTTRLARHFHPKKILP